MIKTTKKFLNRHPYLKTVVKKILRLRHAPSVSTNYAELAPKDAIGVGQNLRGAWQDSSIPDRQRILVEAQLKDYRLGKAIPVFDSLVEAIGRLPPSERSTLLEIGCSSGYYSEVMALRGLEVSYQGCDYSGAFIELARRCYPGLSFDVMDATQLGYEDNQFDVVVSGSCLLHIPDFPAAIAETARVARRYAIFHRTPVLHQSATRHFTKDAYGVRTLEIHFNEQELVRLFAENGLQVIDIATLNAEWRDSDAFAIKTYVCRKVSSA